MAHSDLEIDVYISYAHIDNVPLSENQQGWVSRFHSTLSATLSMRLGRQAVIWRDSKLSGNDLVADEIVQRFPKTKLMISVVTPRYVASEWCLREADEFCKASENTGGLIIGNKSRVLKVVKIPVTNENQLPDVIKNALGYPFYILDGQEKTPFELDPAFGEEFTQKFYRKMSELASDIVVLIKEMEVLSPTGARPVVTTAADSPVLVPSPDQTSAATQSSTEELTKEKGIFISYEREKDGRFALELAKKIKDSGVSVWIDQWDIDDGDNWERAINNAVYDLPGFLIVMSPNAFESDEVLGELRAALNEKKHIFPVLYRECRRPPHALLNIQWTNLAAKGLADEAAIQSLVAKIKTKLSQKKAQ